MEDELLTDFVQEARDHLGDIESQLLKIEVLGEDFDDDLVNTVFRAIHSIKGAAGFLGLSTINRLSHSLENVLGAVRSHKLIPDPFNVDVMLRAADRLRDLIENIQTSNGENVEQLVLKLDEIFDTTLEGKKTANAAAVAMQSHDESAEATPVKKRPSRAKANKDGAADPSSADSSVATTKSNAAKPRKRGSSPIQNHAGSSATKAPTSPPLDSASQSAVNLIDQSEAGLVAAISAQDVDRGKQGVDPGQQGGDPGQPSAGESRQTECAEASTKKLAQPEATIRVGVRVLDRLMNLAGELVLSRNQLLRAIDNRTNDESGLSPIAAELDQVTTELQEAIMQTRMQPIGNVFNKFPRVLRDLSAQLGKQVSLEMEGNEVEVDKTIVEAIADPLTHLIRNSVDHGVESPEVRLAAGKPIEGLVRLRAFHQAGKVVIEIVDDGAGMDPAKLRSKAIEKGVITLDQASRMSQRDSFSLIFAPGFSTAATVTSVSGRGVGMDVVKTNIEKLGGSVEIESTLGKGSTVRILVPLTLAIVPSMIIASGRYRFALPHACIVELVRADGNEKRIERVSGVEVLRIRGQLLPLVRLRQLLNFSSTVIDETTEDQIVVVEANEIRFALAVDQVLDSEEIVVKPLGRHLNNLPLLAGATILGDGKVAMILDAVGISSRAKLSSSVDEIAVIAAAHERASQTENQRLLLLSLNKIDHFAVSMDIVNRIERVAISEIEYVGDQKVLKYGDVMLPLLEIPHVLKCSEPIEPDHVYAIVYSVYGREVGLLAPILRDIRESSSEVDTHNCPEKSVAGVTIIDERVTRVLDVYSLTEAIHPNWFEKYKELRPKVERNRVLVCEDSAFFRAFLRSTLKDHGYEVFDAADGEAGWELLCETPDIHLIVTDVEMPRLGGFGLTERIRSEPRFAALPVIALTSLADDESIRHGLAVGVNEYQVKMNKPVLLETVARLIASRSSK